MSQPAEPNQSHRPYPRVVAYAAKPRRHRPVNPFASANALAMQHQDIAHAVAQNIARRTGHSREDIEQVAMLGILQASRRYSSEKGPFRPFARTYANGEVYHYLRDKGFLIKVPPSWRELYARGQKMIQGGARKSELPARLGIKPQRWEDITQACSLRVVYRNTDWDAGD